MDLVGGFETCNAVYEGQCLDLFPGLVVHGGDEGELGKVVADATAEVNEGFLLLYMDWARELDDPFLVLAFAVRFEVLRDCRPIARDVDLVATYLDVGLG